MRTMPGSRTFVGIVPSALGTRAFRQSFSVFAQLLGSVYLLQAARLVGSLALRAILDPASVGLINAAQSSSMLYACGATGNVYQGTRNIPSSPEGERGPAAQSLVLGSLLEGLIALPVALYCLWWFTPEVFPTWHNVAAVALFWLSFRVLAVGETLLQTLRRVSTVVWLRIARILEVAAALGGAILFQDLGYLWMSSLSMGILAFVAVRAMRGGAPAWGVVRHRLRPTRFGAGMIADKAMQALGSQIDSLTLLAVGGPGALAGYFLGVNLRGAFVNVVSSLYWTLWPQAVVAHDAGARTVFHRVLPRLLLVAGLLAFITLTMLALDFLIEVFLPDYEAHMLEIMVVATAAIPASLVEFDKAELMLSRKTGSLSAFSAVRPAGFAVTAWLLLSPTAVGAVPSLGDLTVGQLIALAAYCGTSAHFLAMTLDKVVRLRQWTALPMCLGISVGAVLWSWTIGDYLMETTMLGWFLPS